MNAGAPVLFDFIGPPPVRGRRLRAVLGWLARKRRHFSFFVLLSLAAHLALFGMVILLGPRPAASPASAGDRARDFLAFQGALRESASTGSAPERLANALMALSEEEVREAFRQAPVLDYRLDAREKAGLYKMMLTEAMAEFTEGVGEGPSALDLPLSRFFGGLRQMPVNAPGQGYALVRIDGPLEEGTRLFKLSKERADALDSLTLPAGGSKDPSAEVALLDEEGRFSTVPGEYFYRDSPYVQIAAAGAGLFYVVKGFPELPSAGAGHGADREKAGSAPEGRPSSVSPGPAAPEFAVFLVPQGAPRGQEPSVLRPMPDLSLSEREFDGVLDGLMALPAVEQVRRFHRDYLEIYDPDSPVLARLTGAFIYRNLGMVFVRTGDPLSRGFDLLEEVFYDNLTLDALVPYALKNPRARTGAEILLALAASYEFESRAIVALDGSLDAAGRILANPAEERFHVHNKNVKAYVVREVYRDLAAELRDRGYLDLDTVIQKYGDERLGIYDYLQDLGGEVRCRARYALGRLHWDEGRTGPAMEIWKDTDPAFADEMLTMIRGAIVERRRSSDAVPRIDDILGRQAAAEKSVQLARIAKFRAWARR